MKSFYASFDKADKERMRFNYRTAVFGMELNSDEPNMISDFDNLYKIGIGIDADRHHTMTPEFVEKLIIELISVPVAFNNFSDSISLVC